MHRHRLALRRRRKGFTRALSQDLQQSRKESGPGAVSIPGPGCGEAGRENCGRRSSAGVRPSRFPFSNFCCPPEFSRGLKMSDRKT
jgi:hypothetical protein